MSKTFSIAVHGGAGTLLKGKMTPKSEQAYKSALSKAINAGYDILAERGNALDAVEKAVMLLENSPLFNAGKGSVFTAGGTHEMDAAIMEGKDLNAGAVSLISGVKNPICLARVVLEKSPHVLLAGTGAMEFARLHNLKFEKEDYFYNEFRYQQWKEIKHSDHFQLDHSDDKDQKFGTVGAVACDHRENLAAATSTGGMTNKNWGRIGDTPLNGIGNYANNATCAVSCTGSGEFFMRGVVAYDLSCLIEHKKWNLKKAAKEVIHHRLLKLNGDGGLIAVNRHGNIVMPFNTEGMYRAMRNSTGEQLIAIYDD